MGLIISYQVHGTTKIQYKPKKSTNEAIQVTTMKRVLHLKGIQGKILTKISVDSRVLVWFEPGYIGITSF